MIWSNTVAWQIESCHKRIVMGGKAAEFDGRMKKAAETGGLLEPVFALQRTFNLKAPSLK
jgi:hypothetical protein